MTQLVDLGALAAVAERLQQPLHRIEAAQHIVAGEPQLFVLVSPAVAHGGCLEHPAAHLGRQLGAEHLGPCGLHGVAQERHITNRGVSVRVAELGVDALEPVVAIGPPPSGLARRAEPVTQQIERSADPLAVGHHHLREPPTHTVRHAADTAPTTPQPCLTASPATASSQQRDSTVRPHQAAGARWGWPPQQQPLRRRRRRYAGSARQR